MNDDVAANGGSVEVTPKSASRRNVEDALLSHVVPRPINSVKCLT